MLSSGSAPALIHEAGASKDDGGRGGGEDAMMEHLFDRVLMASDNMGDGMFDRLMIPRQHIVKLIDVSARSEQADSMGLIVLEDRAVAGRQWHLEWYWSSNQAHGLCLTKRWGLFVEEKGLGAGDTISFFRGSTDGRLFVDCRRRQPDGWVPRSVSATELHCGIFPWPPAAIGAMLHGGGGGHLGRADVPGPISPATTERQQQVPCPAFDEMPAHLLPRRRPRRNRVEPDQPPEVMIGTPTILESSPLVQSPEAKRVRLFGVYLN